MENVSATRQALLQRKARIRLAEQGKSLLEEKRTALMRELFKVIDEVVAQGDKLFEAAQEARWRLALAEAMEGPMAVRSAAIAGHDELPLDVTMVNVMGVHVPEIERKTVTRSVLGRGYSPTGPSIYIDEAAAAFEGVVDHLIAYAETETRLWRLAREIESATRRVNALEQVLIPRLEYEKRAIEMALGEREREDHYRLKHVKRLLERRREEIEAGEVG
jgi:V/A-type H+-transporting ATPase subunit D